MEKAFGEQRTDRPVDQAAGQNLFFRGTPLAFDKAAWNLSSGIRIFTIIDGEREKPGSRFGLIGHTCGDEDYRVPGTNDDPAVRLFGHFARFERDDSAAQVNFNFVRHFLSKPPTSPERAATAHPASQGSASVREPFETGVDKMGRAAKPKALRSGRQGRYGMNSETSVSEEWTNVEYRAAVEPLCNVPGRCREGRSEAGDAWQPGSTAPCGNHCLSCASGNATAAAPGAGSAGQSVLPATRCRSCGVDSPREPAAWCLSPVPF